MTRTFWRSATTEGRPLRVVAGAVVQDGRVLVALRRQEAARGGCWELPGGKVEPGENDREALARELCEELSIEADIGTFLGETTHSYRDLTIHLVAYLAATTDTPIPSEHAEVRWATPGELPALSWADADRALVPALIQSLLS